MANEETDDPSNFFQPTSNPKLPFDDAVRFLTAVCGDAHCPACNNKKWEIPTSEEDDDLCLLVKSGVKFESVYLYNLLLECRVCGWVREHRVDVVLEWIAKDSKTEKNK
jgi:hypothetical protein